MPMLRHAGALATLSLSLLLDAFATLRYATLLQATQRHALYCRITAITLSRCQRRRLIYLRLPLPLYADTLFSFSPRHYAACLLRAYAFAMIRHGYAAAAIVFGALRYACFFACAMLLVTMIHTCYAIAAATARRHERCRAADMPLLFSLMMFITLPRHTYAT